MGKTETGAVWLNAEMMRPYDYWQFWRNCEDGDVGRLLKLFTELPLDEIARLAALKGQELNEAKKVLATEATAILHGREAAEQAAETARRTFEEGALAETLPSDRDSARASGGRPRRARRLRGSGVCIVERRGAPAHQGRRAPGERRHRHRREDGARPGSSHPRRRHQALARTEAPRPAEAGLIRALPQRLRVALRRHAIAARELEELAQQARRDGGDRIDPQHRRARRADHLIGDAQQALVAAAEEETHDRDLAEHVVEAVERDERAAHAHVVAIVVDIAVHRRADRGPLHQTVADGEASERAGEVDPQAREVHARRRTAGLLRRRGDAVERGLRRAPRSRGC